MANTYRKTDDDLVDFLIKEEGFLSKPTDIGDGKITLGSGLTDSKWHELYRKKGKWSAEDNRRAVASEVASRRRWAEKNIPNWDNLSDSSQKALLAYKYNYDFNAANSPKLYDALKNNDLLEAAKQIDATSKDPKFKKGLEQRRARERSWFLQDVNTKEYLPEPLMPEYNAYPVSSYYDNPYARRLLYTQPQPVMIPEEQIPQVRYTEPEERIKMDALNALESLGQLYDFQRENAWENQPEPERFVPTGKINYATYDEGGQMNAPKTWNNLSMAEKAEMMKVAILNGITDLATIKQKYNEFAEGGGIHIKPENRGKFTALKKRTGHSATWFKENGTPAQKKMATFALNSRHWKHDYGGPLVETANYYDQGGQEDYQMENEFPFGDQFMKELTVYPGDVKARKYNNWLTRHGYLPAFMSDAQNETAIPIRQNRFTRADRPLEVVSPEFYALAGLRPGGDIIAPITKNQFKSIGKAAIKRATTKEVSQANLERQLVSQPQIGSVTGGVPTETAEAAERGRNVLLDWVKSPWYKQRLEDEPLYRVADDIVEDASRRISTQPITIKDRSLIDGFNNGVTTNKPSVFEGYLPDGTKVYNLDTGFDVDIASDLGSHADDTALHELLHYMTANSKGEPVGSSVERIVQNGWMHPSDSYFDSIKAINKGRSTGWQNYIIDQNNVLLPNYDNVVDMVMNRPTEAVDNLMRAGRSKADALQAVQHLRDSYSYWTQVQEQRAYLQELFLSKIKPNLKNPNDAVEIEKYLADHPEILSNSIPYQRIQEVRPGSVKDYAKYWSTALGTLPFINSTTIKSNNNETAQ